MYYRYGFADVLVALYDVLSFVFFFRLCACAHYFTHCHLLHIVLVLLCCVCCRFFDSIRFCLTVQTRGVSWSIEHDAGVLASNRASYLFRIFCKPSVYVYMYVCMYIYHLCMNVSNSANLCMYTINSDVRSRWI